MSLRDDINIPVVTTLGLVTGLIVAVAIIGTQAGYNYVRQAEVDRAYRQAEADGSLSLGKRVWKENEAELNGKPRWANVEKTSQTIPLDVAKKLMIETKGAAAAAK